MATKASYSLGFLICTACCSKVACHDFSSNEGKKNNVKDYEDNVNLDDYEGLMSLGVKDVRERLEELSLRSYSIAKCPLMKNVNHPRLIILFLHWIHPPTS